MYTEDIGLKTNKGGLRHRKMKPKCVTIYPNPANKARCTVEIVCEYLSKLPTNRKCEAMYLRPKKNYSPTDWYLDSPVGVNTLSTIVKNMFRKIGKDGHYTNHSLRATSATRMYDAGVSEQVISEVTGHRSMAIREYKRTSNNLKRKASEALYCGPNKKSLV